MIELDLIKSPNQSFKFKDFDITIRLTKNDTYIQIVKNGVLILPYYGKFKQKVIHIAL